MKLIKDNLDIELSNAGILTAVPTAIEFFISLLVSLVADKFITKGSSATCVSDGFQKLSNSNGKFLKTFDTDLQ